jgi:uncharacterized protein (TIGR03086 family)
MTPAAPTAWPAEGAQLLEPSISYALGVARAVTPELLSRPTPCGEWDLRMLLRHTCESLAAFGEGIEAGCVGLNPAAEDGVVTTDPVRAFRDRASQLLDAWTGPGHQRQVVEIAGCPLAANVMAGAAALEVAVHGWDISLACAQRQPIPRALATGLLAIAPVLVPRTGRHPLFAAPVTVAATAGPSDRLAAFLGRSPGIAPRRVRSAEWVICVSAELHQLSAGRWCTGLGDITGLFTSAAG